MAGRHRQRHPEDQGGTSLPFHQGSSAPPSSPVPLPLHGWDRGVTGLWLPFQGTCLLQLLHEGYERLLLLLQVHQPCSDPADPASAVSQAADPAPPSQGPSFGAAAAAKVEFAAAQVEAGPSPRPLSPLQCLGPSVAAATAAAAAAAEVEIPPSPQLATLDASTPIWKETGSPVPVSGSRLPDRGKRDGDEGG